MSTSPDGRCPNCQADNVRRLMCEAVRVAGETRNPAVARSFSVPCYCSRCGAEWRERYRLAIEAVEVVIPGKTGGGGDSR